MKKKDDVKKLKAENKALKREVAVMDKNLARQQRETAKLYTVLFKIEGVIRKELSAGATDKA